MVKQRREGPGAAWEELESAVKTRETSHSAAKSSMAKRLKGKARPETPEEKAARIQALKDAEKYLPVVYAIIAAAVGGIALYFKYLGA